ncbi:hypothetical protein [Paenarthrobacter sp. NPDC057981]|uniref:hypothetical protein n=1 Tax=Paenarthrobacter sp. NPDC057981 TaxID=3346297 RepID=UPI0036DCBDAA
MIGTRVFDMVVNGVSLMDTYQEYHVIVEDREAMHLADLVSIRSDLEGASAACGLFEEEAREDSADTAKLRVFFESAVISYARAFASGKGSGAGRQRSKIENLLGSLDPEQRLAHDDVLSIRNRHVGHRVDPTEQSVMVLATFDRQSLKFKGVAPFLVDRIDGGLMAGLASCVGSLAYLVDLEISRVMDQLAKFYELQESEGRILPEALLHVNPRGPEAD